MCVAELCLCAPLRLICVRGWVVDFTRGRRWLVGFCFDHRPWESAVRVQTIANLCNYTICNIVSYIYNIYIYVIRNYHQMLRTNTESDETACCWQHWRLIICSNSLAHQLSRLASQGTMGWPVQDMVRLRIRYLGRAECRPWKGATSSRKIDRVRSLLGKCGGLRVYLHLNMGSGRFHSARFWHISSFKLAKSSHVVKPMSKTPSHHQGLLNVP